MKYTKEQLSRMYKAYLTKVVKATPWERAEKGEIDEYVNSCGFAFTESYSWGGTLPSADVLFVLGGNLKNYQAFTIEEGKLIELHQEHLSEYCLTCSSKESAQADSTTANNYF